MMIILMVCGCLYVYERLTKHDSLTSGDDVIGVYAGDAQILLLQQRIIYQNREVNVLLYDFSAAGSSVTSAVHGRFLDRIYTNKKELR